MNDKKMRLVQRLLSWLPGIIVITGILLRVAVYLQNRSLTDDEASVARNIYENNYSSLLAPLKYGTYAPPAFLWILKTITNFFGNSEYALRLYPLVCGIISLWLLWLLLSRCTIGSSAWYPLLLAATGYIYIRYGTEIKQYSSDVAVTLSLLLLALSSPMERKNPIAFLSIWIIAGSLAIWFSMPAIFVLAGILAYYLFQAFNGDKRKILPIAAVGIVWAVQFFFYYFIILSDAIHSDYLQHWHKDYFLNFTPLTSGTATSDLQLCMLILANAGGVTVLAIAFHLLLLVAGCVYLFRSSRARFVLLTIPVVCLLAAAGLHKFTLLPRVCLFIMPVLLILIGTGFDQIFKIRYAWPRYAAVIAAIICVLNFNQLGYFLHPYENEEFKKGMAIVEAENIDRNHFHVYWVTMPVYYYYTKISPLRERWKNLSDAGEIRIDGNFDSVVHTFTGKNVMFYEWCDDNDLKSELDIYHKYFSGVTDKPFPGGHVYILTK
jgi:dolichyl-phosphate-mannose-protein mannosyltransferase